ncbi:MAG: FtsX-like permease family protein [Bacteroidota bacterium]
MNNHSRPPKWADRFLEWYCRSELLEEIQGDVYELFDMRVAERGLQAARRHFIWDILRSFRLSTIKGFHPKHSTMLLKSNFKIAIRQIAKQKLYSVIKIGGFALGIAVCLLISLFILDELSYDKHYEKKDRIYRILSVYTQPEFVRGVHFPAPFARTIEQDFPEIEIAGRLAQSGYLRTGSNQIRRSDEVKNSYEDNFIFADASILDILEIDLIKGDKENVLQQPNGIIISATKAKKYFGKEDPIGKTFILNEDQERPLTIMGVMEDLPKHSHFRYDFILGLTDLEFWPGESNYWAANNYLTYVRLKPNIDPVQLEKKLLSVIETYFRPAFKAAGYTGSGDYSKDLTFSLQAVPDIHLHSEGVTDHMRHGDIRFVWLFSAIAIVILLLACINFINLSTAKSANRAKEVGLRKVIGSFRTTLIYQFLTESVVLSFISFILGVGIAWLLLPYFSKIADKSLSFPWLDWWFIPLLLAGSLLIGIIAGIYPAFYLSSFKPIATLSGKLSRGSKGSGLRNALVVFQFTATIVLLISTFVVSQQLDFILNTKLGYDKDQIIVLEGTNAMGDKVKLFKQDLLNTSNVKHVTASDYLPIAGTNRNSNAFWLSDRVETSDPIYGEIWRVDHDYIKTLGMNIKEGRDFSIDMPTDSQAIIINEAMAATLGIQEVKGQYITNGYRNRRLIGIMENFHFASLKEKINNLSIVVSTRRDMLAIKVGTTDISGTIAQIESKWKQYVPNQELRYSFLDESFANMYADVQRAESVFKSFALFAILVACLGLFGLSTFIAEQRSKEISIRKVLGASSISIVRLLSGNFLILIIIALVLGLPLGWYLMNQWLQDYEYSIDLSWTTLALSGLIAMSIALLTVSFEAIRSSRATPIHALRSE